MFEDSCGVGVEISEAQIRESVANLIAADKDAIVETAWTSFKYEGILMGKVLKEFKWANNAVVREVVG